MNGQGINLKRQEQSKDIVGSLMVHPLDWRWWAAVRQGQRLCRSRLFRQSGYSDRRQLHTQPLVGSHAIQTKPVSLRTEYLAGKDGHVKSDGYYNRIHYMCFPSSTL